MKKKNLEIEKIKQSIEMLKFITTLDKSEQEIIIAGIESVIEILTDYANKKSS